MTSSSTATKLPAQHTAVQTTHTDVPGRIKWFNKDRKYGFIICDGVHDDVFLPQGILATAGLKDINPNRPVHVDFGRGPKGLVATSLRV